jgi:hypothetical protein
VTPHPTLPPPPQVIDRINALSKGKPENTATAEEGVRIVESGQLRKGTIVPELDRIL